MVEIPYWALALFLIGSLLTAGYFIRRSKRASSLEKTLRESEERIRMCIDHAMDAVIVMNSKGLIMAWNPQAEKIFGWSQDEALGRRMSEMIIPLQYRPMHEKGLKRFLATGEGPILNKRAELTALHHDGCEFPVELTLSPVHTGKEYIFSAFVRDITDRKRDEAKIKQFADELQRSNKELERFAYVASHDMHEPLRKIITFSDRLKKLDLSSFEEKAHDYIDRMISSAVRMSDLIDDLLILSRFSTKAPEYDDVDLGMVLQAVILDLEMPISRSHARIDVGKLPTIQADEHQMRELFQNLISNAVKFRRPDVEPRIQITSESQGDERFHIYVQDNGIGMEQEHLHQIFQPFYRLHGRSEYEGTGVGLTICQKIARCHGGEVTVSSELGQGTTFKIMLPRSQTP